jgi:excisionase family DNA binding protein
MDSPVMTLPEASKYLKISLAKIYLMVHDKDFPAIKVGGSWRVLRKELDEWLSKQLEDKPEGI